MNLPKIAIVTDSTADIPDELIEEKQIYIVNNIVTMEGKSYIDRIELSRQEFYNKLPQLKNFPKTATASSGTYQTLYEKLFYQGIDFILSIHASSKLSGIYNAASTAAKSFAERVKVIDSENITIGLGFQVLAAAEAAAQGFAIEKIIEIISQLRKRIRVAALIDTLEYVRRSGRVDWVRARLGDALQIKLLVELRNGSVSNLGGARTYRKGVARLTEILTKLGPLENLAIIHSNAEEEAHKFIKELTYPFPLIPLIINVTTVIGSHVGPNCLGFVAVLKN